MNIPNSKAAFDTAKTHCVKWTNYFPIYDQLFSRFQNQEITFVEIGVKSGGSLHMWRSFFGPKARIIGIDLNPKAKKFERDGFEIFIGDQADPEFWAKTLDAIGPIDILLDDGGHRFEQQIITTECLLPQIKDNGLLVIEDTHTSYMPSFGGPTEFSTIAYAKSFIDALHRRNAFMPATKPAETRIQSIEFFDSIVAFKIAPQLCADQSQMLANGAEDFRHQDMRHSGTRLDALEQRNRSLSRDKNPTLKTKLLRWLNAQALRREIRRDVKRQAQKTKHFFR